MRFLVTLALVGALMLAAACSSSEEVVSREIVGTIPWAGPETAKYRVLDSNDDEVGTLDLSIEKAGSGGLLFHQFYDFSDKKFTNEAKVTVDDKTLQPSKPSFKIVGPSGNLDCSATYGDGVMKAHRKGEDGERDDTLSVPRVVYDSWGDLFVSANARPGRWPRHLVRGRIVVHAGQAGRDFGEAEGGGAGTDHGARRHVRYLEA